VRALTVAAVVYDPNVSVIWEIIHDFFDAQGAPIGVAVYSTYEDQNDGLLSGPIDIAWNSRLAWVDAQRRSNNRCRANVCATRTAIAPPTSWRGAEVRCRRFGT